MRGRLFLPVLLSVGGLSLAPGASAATVAFNKPCFREATSATLAGTGFTPNGQVALGRNNVFIGAVTSDPLGAFSLARDSGSVSSGERRFNFQAVDVTNPNIAAATQLRVSDLAVTIRPEDGLPNRVRRVRGRGFVGGRTLYAHVRRGRYKKRVRIGRLRGDCATVSARRRLLRRGAANGRYRVQFDARRRYRRCRRPTSTRSCVIFRVTVFSTFLTGSASAASATTEEQWEQISPGPSGGPGWNRLP